MKAHRGDGRSGFTLLEALISTGVFAVGMMGSFGLLGWILQATAASGRIVAAQAVGQQQIETLMGEDYASVVSGTATEGQYDLAWTVAASNRYKRLSVDVTWETSEGSDKEVTMACILTDPSFAASVPGFAQPGNGGSGGIPTGTVGETVDDVDEVAGL